MLTEFITQFTDQEIVKDFVKINNTFFTIPKQLKQALQQIKTKPAFAGIPFGRQKGQHFEPSLYLLQKLTETSNKKITVNTKGEWMFICGKNIFGKTIIKTHSEMKTGNFVLLQNQHEECIGYGTIIEEPSNKGPVVKNIFDIGDFLRRERTQHKPVKNHR